MKKFLRRYTIFELVLITLFAGLGLATKPIISPLVKMITGPLFIPGGSVAGGFYMLWIVLACAFVKKRGSATLCALTQAIIVIVGGLFGTHGLVSIFTYVLPGICCDLVFILTRRYVTTKIDFMVACIACNVAGSYLSNLAFFRLPLIPLLFSLCLSLLSGIIGGLIAYTVYEKISDVTEELI